jgi:hypothetical protein
MATSGKAAWKKHFMGSGTIQVILKKSSVLIPDGKHSKITLDAGTTVIHEQIKTEKEYLSYTSNPKASNPSANVPVIYEKKRYLCSIDNFAKPSKVSGRIDLGLQTSKLLAASETRLLDIFGEKNIPCAVFKNADDLASVCNEAIKKNRLLSLQNLNLKKSLQNYFESGEYNKIKWYGTITESERAEFKYIGEVSIGLCLLTKKSEVVSGKNPFLGHRVKAIIFPKSESFGGVDSIVEFTDGTMLPISSKAGVGAKPSFWTNIFPSVMENEVYRPKGTKLRAIYDVASSIRATNKDAKKIIYEYGVRKILGIGKSTIKNTYDVYEEFEQYDSLSKYSAGVRTVYNQLKNKMAKEDDETALRNLDESTTVFFSKMIANQLNDDSKSQDIMLEILGQKQFVQLNLDMTKLKSGELSFDAVLVPGSVQSITMTGTKSAYTDLTARNGTVNYTLK